MKIKIAELMAVGIVMLAEPAFSQGMGAGNGGGAHVCPTKNTIEVYDIYEGRSRYGLNIVSTGNSIPEAMIIENALSKLEHVNITFAEAVRDQMDYLNSQKPKHFLVNDQIKLKLIEDANILLTDEGCEYRQLANWDDVSNNVLVKGDFYRALDEYNHAALKLHEAIYKASRVRISVKNSDEVRRLVGELLSDLPDVSETTKKLSLRGDIKNSSDAPKMILNGLNSELYLGKISKDDLGRIGTVTVKIREWEAIFNLEQKINNGNLTSREMKQIRKEIDRLKEINPVNFGFLILNGSEFKASGLPSFRFSASLSNDLFLAYQFGNSNQTITLDISVQKNDGTVISVSQLINLSTMGSALDHMYEFTIYGNIQ